MNHLLCYNSEIYGNERIGGVTMLDNNTVGERIKYLRLTRKMTREELAEAAEISTSFLYEIKTGKKSFSAYTLDKLAQALDLTTDYILHGDENETELACAASREERHEIKLRMAQKLLEKA